MMIMLAHQRKISHMTTSTWISGMMAPINLIHQNSYAPYVVQQQGMQYCKYTVIQQKSIISRLIAEWKDKRWTVLPWTSSKWQRWLQATLYLNGLTDMTTITEHGRCLPVYTSFCYGWITNNYIWVWNVMQYSKYFTKYTSMVIMIWYKPWQNSG